MKTFGPGRNARLMATITGKARTIGPERARVLTVTSSARRIANLERRLRTLRREVIDTQKALRHERKALRAYLQDGRELE